jgi:hypothetical protein
MSNNLPKLPLVAAAALVLVAGPTRAQDTADSPSKLVGLQITREFETPPGQPQKRFLTFTITAFENGNMHVSGHYVAVLSSIESNNYDYTQEVIIPLARVELTSNENSITFRCHEKDLCISWGKSDIKLGSALPMDKNFIVAFLKIENVEVIPEIYSTLRPLTWRNQ